VLQSSGFLTVTEVLQPAASVAVITTSLAMGIPVMLLPLTVPAEVVMVAPAVAENATLYVPPPLHTPLPALRPGGTQPLLPGQLAGLFTINVVTPQLLVELAPIIRLMPTGIPLIVLPDTVP
jgi:hypothetical protein